MSNVNPSKYYLVVTTGSLAGPQVVPARAPLFDQQSGCVPSGASEFDSGSGQSVPFKGKESEKNCSSFFCPKNSLKFKLLAFWSKVDKTCTYEKVPKIFGQDPTPPSPPLDKIQKKSSFFSGDLL